MNRRPCLRNVRPCAGVAAVELAIILPILLLLVMMVVDFARAIQTQIILVNITREGASLASRSPAFQGEPQKIMNALVATTPPLRMNDVGFPDEYGMLYITEVTGYQPKVGDPVRNVVTAQHRWVNGRGSYLPVSKVWQCASWAVNGRCSGVPATPGAGSPTANVMTGKLAAGDVIYAVEAFYRFDGWFELLALAPFITTPEIGPDLRAMSVM
ncbi:MAG: TadE/TadG family type IV pilus assembly protein [Burkholderiaceae bacterium]